GETMTGTVIVLMNKSDTTKVLSTMAEDEGIFELDRVPSGTYILRTLLMGYQIKRIEITVAGADVDLGSIKIEEDQSLTTEVEIKARTLRVEQKGDTTVINADAYKTNPDATTEDLVTKMPGVTVQNGEVKVNGE